MLPNIDPLEARYDSRDYAGMIRSGFTLLDARRVRLDREQDTFEGRLQDWANKLLYTGAIVVPGVFVNLYQQMMTAVTGEERGYSNGAWQFYLQRLLREDLAHFTVETEGYHDERPENAVELDDITAWVMALIQFVWSYEELMGVVWDEWTMLRIVAETAEAYGLSGDPRFARIQRDWLQQRPYGAPLNGTYADVRRAAFEEFIMPKLELLPDDAHEEFTNRFTDAADIEREAYQKQMSILSRLIPNAFMDAKEEIPLWNASVALVINGRYYLIRMAAHDEKGRPTVYGQGGSNWPLIVKDGIPYTPDGRRLVLRREQLYVENSNEWVGYLDMASVAQVKWQLKGILEEAAKHKEEAPIQGNEIDILLCETPRRNQKRLRSLLPEETQRELEIFKSVVVVINWDERDRTVDNNPNNLRPLAELRRAHRGIGDHALTIMRTKDSMLFDLSHVYFDGVWALAMSEVLTNSSVRWCERSISILPYEAPPARVLLMRDSPAFFKEGETLRQPPEISAETTIHSIYMILQLRKMLQQ
ncbi:MAG: hypothetical protein GYB68_00305, partial [Chloroflexi bacterium]|nr:hypothetical protein [Chloroflexota bacterium]